MLQTTTQGFPHCDPYYYISLTPTALLPAKWAPYCSLNQSPKIQWALHDS